MQRIGITPRLNYKEKLEALSFEFHSLDNIYWNEGAYYKFTLPQVNVIEKATNELFDMCLKAVQYVIDNDLFDKFYIEPELIPLIIRSWENEEPSFYGRFDFGYDGTNQPKMLEFNADTPTSLYEAAVVQWFWLQEVMDGKDQFNSMHERLINYWKSCLDYFNNEVVHFACIKESVEDFTTVEYIRDTAYQAGINTKFIYMDDIGWDYDRNIFVDQEGHPIQNIFKLYPWEWIMGEDFGKNIMLDVNQSKWIEPAWKAILSNKAILPILWQLYPNHPNLLECYFDEPHGMTDYVEKPIYSREGANVTIYHNQDVMEFTDGEYGDEGFIYQQLFNIPNLNGNYPIVGSWVIGGESAGMGIRESDGRITGNLSRFVPHIID